MDPKRSPWPLALALAAVPWIWRSGPETVSTAVSAAPPAAQPPSPLEAAQAWSAAFETLSAQASPAVLALEALEASRLPGRQRLLRRGSGVLLSADGLAVTCAHVMAGASGARASLPDGRRFDAEILITDPETDLALIRLAGQDLPHLRLSARGRPRVGQWVLALGNPGGLGLSVTAGIVSGLGRNNLGVARYEDFIQTDAEINPGNSGGALIDLHGELVGINTAIGTEDEGTVGISFAVPVRWVEALIEDVNSGRAPQRGYLGVTSEYLGEWQLLQLAYDGASRVRVIGVDGPARAAGLEIGDVIERVGEHAIVSRADLSAAAAWMRPGSSAPVALWRAGERLQLEVTFAARER
jgi:S1-C subfamily serine protease